MKDIHIISKLVARENNFDPDLTDDVLSFYWKHGVRAALSSMEYTSVSIKHLGTITVSKRKVDFIIRKLIYKIRNIRKSTRYKASTTELLLEVNYEKLRKALKQRNVLAKQYYENYTKRINRIRKATTDNTTEFGQDIRSNIESGEKRVGDVIGGGTTGDNEEKINMYDMSTKQLECCEGGIQDG